MAHFGHAFSGSLGPLKTFLDANGGQVDTVSKDRKCSLLYTAARQGHLDMVKALVKTYGANVNRKNTDESGSTPLHGASYGGHHEVVDFLMSRGAKQVKNKYGETPLDNAKEPDDGVSSGDKAQCIKVLQAPPRAQTPEPPKSESPQKSPPKKETKKKNDDDDAPPKKEEAEAPKAPVDEEAKKKLEAGSITALRALATANGLGLTGTKAQIIARLLEAGVKSLESGSCPKKASPKKTVSKEEASTNNDDDNSGDKKEDPPLKKAKTDCCSSASSGDVWSGDSIASSAACVNDAAWIEALKNATFTKTEVDRETEDFWGLEEKVMAWNQGRNEDYVQNRIKKKKKPLTFIVKRAWKVTNPLLEKAFNQKRDQLAKTHTDDPNSLRVRVAFHGSREANIDSIVKTSLLRFKHPLNPCKEQADDGYFGTNKSGVYVSRYFDYTLKYCNGLNPLDAGDRAKIIMFKCLPGKNKRIEKLNMGMAPTPGYDSHSSPTFLEWYLFDERQLCPDYIIEIEAKEDTRTAADDE